MKHIPANCFTCQHPVFEFEDDKFGCENCKAIWTFNEGAWMDITKKKKQRITHERNYGNNN